MSYKKLCKLTYIKRKMLDEKFLNLKARLACEIHHKLCMFLLAVI